MNQRRTQGASHVQRFFPKVRSFLLREGKIKNSQLRTLTGLEYDQAISFFNAALGLGLLVRKGRRSGTHYVLPGETTDTDPETNGT